MREAEAHAEEDKARRDLVDVRNQADSLSYSVEKTLSENRDKLAAGDIGTIEAAAEALKKAMQGEDAAAIRKAMDELQKASHAMADVLYKQAQAKQAPGGAGGPGGTASAGPEPGGAPGSGDVIDAEVVDDGKK
jgi:molecular chaperone DnaK